MELDGKRASVTEMLNMLHCNAAFGLKTAGVSTTAGRMNMLNLGSSISDICFVDSSVTGMFERRSTIEP